MKYTGELANHWLPDLLGWIVPLLFFVGIWGFFFRRMSGAEGGVMSFARSRAKVYADDEVKVRFVDVAGVDEAEDELKEIVEFLKNPKKYTNLGGRIPKGVLLVGPPGTGKTLLARAVAGEAHVPFFSLSGSEFVEMFVGVGAARIRDLFQQAEAKAPCIVFIDELDALGKARMQGPFGGHEEREQTLNQLLAEMDGFDSRKGVIIMGATNRPEVLDAALLRPGRFDRQVLVDKPDVKGREEILRIHTRGVKTAPNVDLKVVAARTAGFAGADLANLVNEAALLAARTDKLAVEMKDFESAIDRLIAGLEKKRVMSTKERKIVAYHESGHAIVATVLPGLDPVHKISIVQRGFGALGYTMQLPLEDRYLMTRDDLLQPARGAARRPDGRGDRARRDLDRRAERPAARHRHGARDGHRVRHERRARRGQLRRPRRSRVPGHAVRRRSAARYAEETARNRRGDQADHHRAHEAGRAQSSTERARSEATLASACSKRKSSKATNCANWRAEASGPIARRRSSLAPDRRYPIFCIAARNSALLFVLPILSSSSSIASTGDSGVSTLRSTQMRLRSSFGMSSSSLRVPLLMMSMAGNTRLSTSLRSRWISMLPVPLNSSKITSSMREPVSMSAVDMIVSEPPSSMLRAAPKKRFGFCSAFESRPPDRTLPDGGATVL